VSGDLALHSRGHLCKGSDLSKSANISKFCRTAALQELLKEFVDRNGF